MSDIIDVKFDLVEPKEVIDQYIDIWENGCNARNKTVQLFTSIDVDLSGYKCIKNKKYGNIDEEELKPLFSKLYVKPYDSNSYINVVKQLDTIYNTMLNEKCKNTAMNIYENCDNIFSIKKQIEKEPQNDNLKKKLVDHITCINKKDGGNYVYSFATKFCSFLIEDGFPIFDSIVSTLVWKYLKNNNCDCSHDKMGDYGYYLEKYKEFIEIYSLKAYSFKQIDIFLWLYGKIMTEYWEKIGVIRFSSVYYRDPTK